MPDSLFPERPLAPPVQPDPVVRVVRREPLAAIRQVLSISIDDVVNHRRHKRVVADFYRITRQVENEAWLRRRIQEDEEARWVAAHL